LPPRRVSASGATYTFAQLRDRARDQSFSSQEEFQRVVEARLQAQNATLNLLPHFGLQTFLNVASLSPLTMLKAVGDLVPFLLPSHWFHAKGEKFESQAELYGWLGMRADAIHVVEGLSLAIAKDESTSDRLRKHWAEIREIRDLIRAKEASGLLQAGSSDDITSMMNSIADALILMKSQLDAEYAALAQASGFNNPDSIAEITELPTANPEEVTLPDRSQFLAKAANVSPEIAQMSSMVEAARWARRERFFTWLDPSGDPNGEIGFGLGSYVALGRAHQQELIDKQNEISSLVAQTAATTLDAAAEKLGTHRLAMSDAVVQANRVERLMRNLRLGIGFSMSDLVGALQDSVKNGITQDEAQYELQTELAKLDRLGFTGGYAGLNQAGGQ
jgi:hypothetical protein